MNGAFGGNTGTTEVVIKILDINDNIPTLEKESVRTKPPLHFYFLFSIIGNYIYYIVATLT